MTQQYTPVTWQDETTSQQGTLINAERLNQMQTAHHFADGFEEVDAVPTADPGVDYHKIVYCTADSTFYRWDGTAWTADIDDETKRLLQQEIARATEAEGELAQDIADETTARETADTAMQADITAMQSGKLDKQTAGLNQTKIYAVKGSTQKMLLAGSGTGEVPLYGYEENLLAKMPTYGLTDDTVVNYGWTTAQIGAEATARAEADTLLGGRIDTEQARAEAAEQANAQAIANTYTKAETDTLLAGKADQATTYSKMETDTLLGAKADSTALATLSTRVDTLDAENVKLTGPQTIRATKTFMGDNNDTPIIIKSRRLLAGTGVFYNIRINSNDDQEVGNIASYKGTQQTSNYLDVIRGTVRAEIGAIASDTGGAYAFAPTPGSGAPTNAVTTINWVSQTGDNAPNNLLHRNANETFTGVKINDGGRIVDLSAHIKNTTGATDFCPIYKMGSNEMHIALVTYVRGGNTALIKVDATSTSITKTVIAGTMNNRLGIFTDESGNRFLCCELNNNGAISTMGMIGEANAGFICQIWAIVDNVSNGSSGLTQVAVTE